MHTTFYVQNLLNVVNNTKVIASKRVRGPSRVIYTRGVKDHSAKAKYVSVCISLNNGRVTIEQLKGARVAAISRQEQYRDNHPSKNIVAAISPGGLQSIHYEYADNTLELEITNPSLAEVGQTGNSANGSYNSQFTQILCRQDQPVSSELEGTEQGQMGPTNCDRRISHPTFVHPLARDLAAQPSVLIRESSLAAGGGSWPAGEAGNPISPKLDQGILLRHVYGTKERWRSETSYQPKKTEQPREVGALQDEEPSYREVSHTEGRLDDENRPEGCLLHGTSSSPVPTSPSLQSECRVIQIPMSPLRPMHGPESIHESPKTSHRAIEDSRHQTSNLHGRHVAHGQIIQEHTYTALFLLENLGFIINNKKSSLSPSQQIDFLGMTVDSQAMELKLPGEKIKKIRTEAQNLLTRPETPARSVAQLLGKLNVTNPALQVADLFCRSLQTCLRHSLAASSQNYQSTVRISPQAVEDLQWWIQHLTSWNGRSLISPASRMMIDSDASLWGWGATCKGISTWGPWSPQEQTLHINCLELLAATLAVQTFAKEKSGISILLRIDNTTAVAYINRKGGTVSPTLSNLAKTCGCGVWRGTSPWKPSTYQES